jgi:hypothetical protein
MVDHLLHRALFGPSQPRLGQVERRRHRLEAQLAHVTATEDGGGEAAATRRSLSAPRSGGSLTGI